MQTAAARLELHVLVGLAIGLSGCGDLVLESDTEVEAGELGLHCKHGDVELYDVEYTVLRSGQVYRSGNFVIGDDDEGFATTIGPLAAGDAYTLELSGRALREWSGQSTECTASTPFSVLAGQTTSVAVTLRCLGLPSHVEPDENECPSIDSVRASPSQALIGETVTLETNARDRDDGPAPLSYSWSATAGTLGDTDEPRATFQCTSIGKASITLRVSDGDAECSNESVTVHVQCVEKKRTCGCSKKKTAEP